MLCLFLSAPNNPNLRIFWLCHGGQREERPGSPLQTTSLPTHCTNLMTSSLCTIHRSWTCPVMTASAIYTVSVAFRHTLDIYESRRSLCCWSLIFPIILLLKCGKSWHLAKCDLSFRGPTISYWCILGFVRRICVAYFLPAEITSQ